jgi:hypothetical protein
MKSTFADIHYIAGDQAYFIYWIEVYGCLISISSIMTIDKNLEIIIDNEGKLLAFRYDYPEDMKGLLNDDGQWNLYNPQTSSSLAWLYYELNSINTEGL